MSVIPDLEILALNDAESSENRIHSDETAHKYGFDGALVSGANVFGYLSQPLVKVVGESWLQQRVMEVKFYKPAYQNDLLTIKTAEENDPDHYLSSAFNQQGILLAKLESWLPSQLAEVSDLASANSEVEIGTRAEIEWGLIHLQQPAPAYSWQPSQQENQQHIDTQRDESSLYQGEDGFIHPYFLLDSCNQVLKRMFVSPAWIHTGSRLILRQPMRLGQTIDVHSVPIQKWERKGHQFIKLYIAMWIDGEVALEVEHSAIFRIAG